MADEILDQATTRYLQSLRSAHLEADNHMPGNCASDGRPVESSHNAASTRRERRRYPRYRCAGSAQLREQGTTVRTWGTFTDISRSGCYVEVQATFPPGTKMNLVLEWQECRVATKAVVRITYPFVGMGLEFTEISEENVARLDHLLSLLAGTPQAALETEKISGHSREMRLSRITDSVSAIDAVIKHFRDSDSLSREEFVVLIRDSQSHSHP